MRWTAACLHKLVGYNHMVSSDKDWSLDMWMKLGTVVAGDAELDKFDQMDGPKTYW